MRQPDTGARSGIWLTPLPGTHTKLRDPRLAIMRPGTAQLTTKPGDRRRGTRVEPAHPSILKANDMVYLSAVCAAAALALGWVLQHHVACRVEDSGASSTSMLRELMHRRLWWGGIGSMAIGQTLAGLALQLGPVTIVGPLLSTNLLFAFLIRAVIDRERPHPPELIGAALLCVALGVFLAVADPHSSAPVAGWQGIAVSSAVIIVVVTAIVALGRRQGPVAKAVLAATGAGVLYGMQDASTRGAFVFLRDSGLVALPHSAWPYLLLLSAVLGVLLSQIAFRAARLDYSLPPIAVAEPIVAGALGIALLGDRLAVSVSNLVVESLSVAAMVTGVVLVGRSGAIVRAAR
jgi:drug/metabolite transporter (DMT)-like permease